MYWLMPVIMKLFMINHSSGAYAYLHCIKKWRNWCYAEVSADCSGGSAGENTRPSPEGKLDAKPTPLSNEAGAVAKTDESFGGESKFSIDFFPLQNHYRLLVLEWSQLDVLDWYSRLHSKMASICYGNNRFSSLNWQAWKQVIYTASRIFFAKSVVSMASKD